jgi:CPA1 family monovalent cation:H+ antiporter
MTSEIIFVLLFVTATAVALVARWLKAPYTVALVVTGVVLGSVRAIDPPHLTKELLYAIFLPGLLFEAAFHLEIESLRRNKIAIVSLAVPGVIVAMALTAAVLTPALGILHVTTGFAFIHAIVFAALIAATDPIAVVAMFKSLGAPRRLRVLLEGESLLNDGTAIVFFSMVLTFMDRHTLTVAGAAVEFAKVVGIGALIGFVIAFIVSSVIRRVDDAMIEITLTTIAAYGSFAAAEQFHVSGVIATVVAGMVVGNYGRHQGMGPSTRVAVESFWEYVAFALNSVVFLLIGFQVRLEALLGSWSSIVLAYVAVMLARAVVVAVTTAMLARSRERLPWRWGVVMTWGGLRGALSMVLVLALPDNFPHRQTLVTMTFGVVLLSLLLQGLTVGPLLRRLGIVNSNAERETYERLRGGRRAAAAALEALDALVRQGRVHEEVVAAVRDDYTRVLATADLAIRDLHLETSDLLDEEMRAVRRALMIAEKATLLDEQRHGLAGVSTTEHLLHKVDERLAELEAGADPRTTDQEH